MSLEIAKDVLRTEAEAILSVISRLDSRFVEAIDIILNCKGHVIVSGMGKAGLTAQKISATLTATGTPSFFIHPAEALHGDLGRILPDDIILILSNSGETEEILKLIPHVKRIGAKIISITSRDNSTLARSSDVVIPTGDIEEACPLGLAPSASSTTMMAIGDALAFSLLSKRGFNKEQFARFHPAGNIAKKFLKVSEIMRTGERCPLVKKGTLVKDALLAITKARAGAVGIIEEDGKLCGIFTDGDLRRSLAKNPDTINEPIENFMTKNPVTVSPDTLAVEAAKILKEKKIDEMPVVDKDRRPVGVLDVQDLLDVGII
jgi:arabinose-5-phosphate isomerase